MAFMKPVLRSAILAGLAMLAGCGGHGGEGQGVSAEEKARLARLFEDQFQQAWKIGETRPSDEMRQFLLWPDAVVASEGEAIGDTPAKINAMIEGTDKSVTDCHHKVGPLEVDGNLATGFARVDCKTKDTGKPLKIDVLYVWQKRGAQWKNIREAVLFAKE
jgi:hypothetical protein